MKTKIFRSKAEHQKEMVPMLLSISQKLLRKHTKCPKLVNLCKGYTRNLHYCNPLTNLKLCVCVEGEEPLKYNN